MERQKEELKKEYETTIKALKQQHSKDVQTLFKNLTADKFEQEVAAQEAKEKSGEVGNQFVTSGRVIDLNVHEPLKEEDKLKHVIQAVEHLRKGG